MFFLHMLLSEICDHNTNELAEYGMICTDEDGFLVKPLGVMFLHFSFLIVHCSPLFVHEFYSVQNQEG